VAPFRSRVNQTAIVVATASVMVGLVGMSGPVRGATRTSPKTTIAGKQSAKAAASTINSTKPTSKSSAASGKTLDAATVASARGESVARSPAKGEPYRFGLLLARLNEQTVVGEVASEQQRGAELAVAFVNELGGIGGRPVSLTVADEGATPQTAVKGFEGLVRQGVYSVIGPTVSKHARAVSLSAERETTLLFGASVAANGIVQLSPWVRRSAFSPDVIAAAAVNDLLATKPMSTATVAWVSPSDDAGPGSSGSIVAGSYLRAFTRANVPVEEVELKSPAEVDASAIEVAKRGSDVVVVVGSPTVSATFVAATLRAGSRSVILVDPSAMSQEFVARCTLCVGVTTPLIFDTEDATSYSRALLLRRYFDAYGTLPTASAAQGFTAIQILSIALDAAITNERTPQTLTARRDALRREVTVGRYDTPFGLVTFDSQGEVKLDRVTLGEIVQSGTSPRIRALPQVPTSILTS
jgi:branched-chain amino acid transport system substrate-binding protein